MEIGKQNTGVKKRVADWAKATAFRHHEERMAGRAGGGLQVGCAAPAKLAT